MEKSQKSERLSDESVKKATGRTWDAWFRILDNSIAKNTPHKEITEFLRKEYKVPSWWTQMVTVTYEQARGLREKNENAGGYTVSVSKTLPVSVDELYATWSNDTKRAEIIGETVEPTSETKNRYFRAVWIDGVSRLEIGFYPKGTQKSQITLQHSKLKNKAEVEKMRIFWKKVLSALESSL